MAEHLRTLKQHPARIIAAIFTAASAVWTLYSVWDMLGVGPVALTAGLGAEGLWVGGMLAYRVKPTRLTATAMIAGLVGTLAILSIHGAMAYGWGGIVAAVPPLAAELFWHVDGQLSADPAALTTEQQNQVNGLIREARYITAEAAAEQQREDAQHAAKLARIRRDGDLRMAEDRVDFEVHLERIGMQRQINRRAPLALPAPPSDGPDWDGPDKPPGHRVPVSEDMLSAVREALAVMPDASPEDIARQLQHAGVQPTEDTARGQQDGGSGHSLHVPGESIAATVRRAVRTHGDNLDAVLSYVRRVHGEDVKPNTVAKTLKRVAG